MDTKALTLLSSVGGCAAKVEPALLQEILTGLSIAAPDESDSIRYKEDVGILSWPDNTSSAGKANLAQSIDMITPVSDDPAMFGSIAAAHALSDLYAKGASPLSGLLLLSLPALMVSSKIATAILQGAVDKLHEAGARFLGGHTIASQELQLGVSVTGRLPDTFLPNTGCKIDDRLVLTKPLGTGVVVTALKLRNAGVPIEGFSEDIIRASERSMLSLNDRAARIMVEQEGVHACTDVTGFGLLGHLVEMLYANNLSAQICFSDVPIIRGSLALAAQDILSAGGERNAAFFWKSCTFSDNITYAQKMLLFDPQTSGGLLISVSKEKVASLLEKFQRQDIPASIIGQITQRENSLIDVL